MKSTNLQTQSLSMQQQNSDHLKVQISPLENEHGKFKLSIYNKLNQIALSKALPILENAGLFVFSESTSQIKTPNQEDYFLHDFIVNFKFEHKISQTNFDQFLCTGLIEILNDQAENDILNSLLLTADLNVRAITLIRTYTSYLWQVNKFASRSVIMHALASVPNAAKHLWKMFEIKFNPEIGLTIEQRKTQFACELKDFRENLRKVTDITNDRILRSIANILEHTVRTNFYTKAPAIAIKVLPQNIETMPKPRPMFEIFVRSQTIEGIHLRSGVVARGGIRWSDRSEDYRSEVLGLMKTQRVKNVIIVPTGAKGGFIVRRPSDNPEQFKTQGVECYKDYVRSLLSITDNRVNGDIVKPQGVICYDANDPYIVVAADKGTASFSDTANKIAVEEFNFWLGDAFASGGSNGYDHKLYAITANGAWECVMRHFKDAGIDAEKQAFSVVGIGDMSGDVFGNGLLYSSNIKLLAAFNHKHIFIDPTPETESSFKERKRLFTTAGSQWSDYNNALISKGGAIFNRSSKEITLSPEARKALNISSDVPEILSGEQVINHILKADVDLLWNGGIGTYFKSSSETHADCSDSANDAVRIDASELRAKIIGEGGNLGFTQKARVEYALNGGRINTDAIDNSGGVDLSDHEVNTKILFRDICKSRNIPIEKRNQILKEISQNICQDVLAHNHSHALMLSLSSARSIKRIEYFKSLIRDLAKLGYLDRNLESIPDDEEIDNRAANKQGLTRPEIAVITANVKMWLKDSLLKGEFLNDPILRSFLHSYFPAALHKDYLVEINRHPLAREIIATQLVGYLVDKMGPTFVHRMCIIHAVQPVTVFKCFIAATMVLESAKVRNCIQKYDTIENYKIFLGYWQDLNRTLQNATSWLIKYHGNELTLQQIVDFYAERYRNIVDNVEEIILGESAEKYKINLQKNSKLNIPERVAGSLACFPEVLTILGMLWSAKKVAQDPAKVASVYFQLIEQLKLNKIFDKEDHIEMHNKWEAQILISSMDEIRYSVAILTSRLLEQGISKKAEIIKYINESSQAEAMKTRIDEIGNIVPPVAAIALIARDLAKMC